eukprot:GILK01011675.1.p1 GENE.GILK01011675.1~~GILK01011675.1.p1  ORF type:complete len:305 (+),score=44.39 GILK01011675.1:120-1034(+)
MDRNRSGSRYQPRDNLRDKRIAVFEEITRDCLSGKYFNAQGAQVLLPQQLVLDSVSKNVQYRDPSNIPQQIENCYKEPSKIIVARGDCVTAALQLKQRGLNPALLNMASAKHAGGGVVRGAGAQEENLHRRSNYFQHLSNPQKIKRRRPFGYPIPEFGGIYSPSVLFFRGTEADGYPYLDAPVPISCIAVAAYNRPDTTLDGRLTADIAQDTKRKIQMLLRIAVYHKHDSIVLSALGCGAYRNPPAHIAELFKEVIYDEFLFCFKEIVFAIFDDHNAHMEHNPRGNLRPFSDVFEVAVTDVSDL